jgi:MFS family permease
MDATVASETKADNQLTKTILLQLLLLGAGFCFYSINRFAFPIGLKDIGQTYQFTAIQVGTLGTAFLLGQGIIDIPTGYFADKINRRFLFFVSVFGMGATLIGFIVFTYDFWSALFWRVAFGCTEGIFNICLFAFAGSILPRRRAFLNNLMGAFYGLGGILGPTIYGLLNQSAGQWQPPLVVIALATMAWSLVLLAFLRISDKDIPALALQRSLAPAGDSFFSALKRLARIPDLWKAITIPLLNLISQWGYGGLGAYLLITVKHVDVLFAGTVIALAFGLGPLVAPLLGLVADKFGRKYVIVVLAIVLIVALYVLFASDIVSGPALLVAAFFVGVGTHTIYWLGYTIVQDAAPPSHIAFATGITGGLGYLVASTTGFFIGLITQHFGYQAAVWSVLIAPEVAVVVCALALLPNRPREQIG